MKTNVRRVVARKMFSKKAYNIFFFMCVWKSKAFRKIIHSEILKVWLDCLNFHIIKTVKSALKKCNQEKSYEYIF